MKFSNRLTNFEEWFGQSYFFVIVQKHRSLCFKLLKHIDFEFRMVTVDSTARLELYFYNFTDIFNNTVALLTYCLQITLVM